MSKAHGLKVICEDMGITLDEAIAVGDNYNDLPMIEAAGLGAAMLNSPEDIKEKADYVSENDCDNDGLAEIVNKFIIFQ